MKIAIVTLSLAMVAGGLAQTYTCIDLGKNYFPYAIDASNRVVGTFFPTTTSILPVRPDEMEQQSPPGLLIFQPFYYVPATGVKTLISIPPQAAKLNARGISADRYVCGTETDAPNGQYYGYRYDLLTSSYVRFDNIYLGYSWGKAIDPSGQVVCHTNGPAPTLLPVNLNGPIVVNPGLGTYLARHTPTTPPPYPLVGTIDNTKAVNSFGAIVGGATTAITNGHTEAWISGSGNSVSLLGTGGYTNSLAYAITNSPFPVVAGKCYNSLTVPQAFYKSSAGPLTLLTIAGASSSTIYGMNDSSRSVGSYQVTAGTVVTNKAFAYTIGGSVTDLNTMTIAPGNLEAAFKINNSGYIVGYMKVQPTRNSPIDYHGFLLIPSPQPQQVN
jgi:hypothetical protein